MALGPNVKKLIVERASQLQIDRAKQNQGPGLFSLAAAVAAGMQEHLASDLRAANEWVRAALHAIRSARGGEHYTDETAAAEVLAGIEKRRKGK